MQLRIASMSLILCLPLAASAQQSNTLPEELLIIGERNLYQLRNQMLEAEKQAYEIFNKFNDEKRFNISCSVKARTGSIFKAQLCQPEFEIQASRAHGQAFLESYRNFLGSETISGVPNTDGSAVQAMPMADLVASQQEDYKRKLRQVAEQHPEFLDAITSYGKVREQYEQSARP